VRVTIAVRVGIAASRRPTGPWRRRRIARITSRRWLGRRWSSSFLAWLALQQGVQGGRGARRRPRAGLSGISAIILASRRARVKRRRTWRTVFGRVRRRIRSRRSHVGLQRLHYLTWPGQRLPLKPAHSHFLETFTKATKGPSTLRFHSLRPLFGDSAKLVQQNKATVGIGWTGESRPLRIETAALRFHTSPMHSLAYVLTSQNPK